METKYNVIIIDDIQSEIDIVKRIINVAGLSDYLNVYECLYVKQGGDDKTLSVLLPKLNRVDIGIIDWLFENEFGGDDAIEAGGLCATNLVKEKFPNCKILFATKFPLDAKDARIVKKYDAIHLKKETDDAALYQGKKRLEDDILKECIKQRLFEISANETAKKECFQAIQGDTIEWDSQITIGTERWTFENLFFIYKNQPKEKINELFKKYLVRFPKIKPREGVNRWEKATGLYKSPLKDYYFLLYGSYYAELTNITNKAKLFLDNLFEFLLTYLKTIDNNDEKKENESLTQIKNNILERAESICNIREKVPIISENPYIALQQFTKKLISRLISITSYVLFDMSVPSILYLFTKNDFQSTNNAKLISHFLFIFEMRYDEQQSDFESFIYEFSEPKGKTFKVYKPIDRKYTTILGTMEEAGSCSDYELDFISSYFKEIKDRVQKENNDIINAYFNETFNVLNGSEVLKNRNNS